MGKSGSFPGGKSAGA